MANTQTSASGAGAAAPPAEGTASEAQRCGNCASTIQAGDCASVGENGALFCSQNCYWSVVLDVNNSRLKRKKRKGRGGRRRAKRQDLDDDDASAAGTPSSPLDGLPRELNHALFAFHSRFAEIDSVEAWGT